MFLKSLSELVYYANKHLYLNEKDNIYKLNELMHLFNVDEPYEGSFDKKKIDAFLIPDELIISLLNELEEKKIELPYDKETLIAEVMGILSPLPSEVTSTFNLIKEKDPRKASLYLYDLGVKNYYIQKTNIERNKKWVSKDNLVITINLSKPEKDNKDIKKLIAKKDTSYPKCALCYENLGFFGNGKFVNRKNIRHIPLTLDKESWFMQYSPYGYFDEHLIAIKDIHDNMEINSHYIECLFDFVDEFPFYFIGSNSDLPIVGGSILNHEHFQGGKYLMPLMTVKDKYKINVKGYEDIDISYLDWFNSAFLIKGKNRKKIAAFADFLFKTWVKYDDLDVDILSFSDKERHNSITPILRKEKDVYYLYVILRNNRTSKEYPDGIFHAHPEYHHIKKEGIGLIEAMGYFILPGRLMRQTKAIEKILNENISKEKYLKEYPDLSSFINAIEEMKKSNEKDKSLLIKNHIEEVAKNILINTATFKNDKKGIEALFKFIKVGLKGTIA